MTKFANISDLRNCKAIISHPSPFPPFLGINSQCWRDAFSNIDDKNAFGIYLALTDNRDGYPLNLTPFSRSAIYYPQGISDDDYIAALNLLIEKRYLTKSTDEENTYRFTPYPSSSSPDTDPQPKGFIF